MPLNNIEVSAIIIYSHEIKIRNRIMSEGEYIVYNQGIRI